jgi:putative transposase
VAPLAREFGISRQTGHKWLKRFKERGYEGLEEESRRPKVTPLATAEDVVLAVLSLRQRHPTWGARKLVPVLQRSLKEATPSVATVARILRRLGMIKARRLRRVHSIVEHAPNVVVKACNDLWTIDLKGRWNSADRRRCEPLTIRDAHSRMVFAAKLNCGTGAEVRKEMTRLFRKYGVPRAIQCDNGTPFVAVSARGGLSRLSAWWVSLGIQLVRGRPAHPQDNGGHERMHRDIASEVEVNPSVTIEHQQRALDKWRQTFNCVRPHEALRNKTPAEVYSKSARAMVVRNAQYKSRFKRCKVGKEGHIWFGSTTYFVSASLAGHVIGLEPIRGVQYRIWFYEMDLGTIDLLSTAAERVIEDNPGAGKAA